MEYELLITQSDGNKMTLKYNILFINQELKFR